jgi:exodeoxyribonuclease V gamma subunit
VVVGQLRDELRRRFADLPKPMQHPLQPFSLQYFQPESPFRTYDDDWQPRAPAELPQRVAGQGDAELPLPVVVTIADLQRLLKQPVEVYWRGRLGVHLDDPDTAIDEDEPFELDTLEEYQVVQDLLQHLQIGGTARAREQLFLSGRLPLAAPGERLAREFLATAQQIDERVRPLRESHSLRPTPLQVAVEVGGHCVEGSIANLYVKGDALLQLAMVSGATSHKIEGESRPRHAALLRPWVIHLCLAAAGHPITTVIAGADGELHIKPLPQDFALDSLGDWLAVLRDAWSQPLPITPKAACAYLNHGERHDFAQLEFQGTNFRKGEWDYSAYLRRSFTQYEDVRAGIETYAFRLYGHVLVYLRMGPP